MSITAQVHTLRSTGGLVEIDRNTKSACTLSPLLCCLNALLIFWVQPLFAKMVLPLLGGSPSVWTTCMLFFQAALLAGYAYGHAGIRALGIRRHAMLHGVIVWLPLMLLPIGVNQDSGTAANQPIAWLLQTMGIERRPALRGARLDRAAAAALVLVARQSIVADPYWLYSASNVGSFAALLAFPILFEPAIPLGRQTRSGRWLCDRRRAADRVCDQRAATALVIRRHASKTRQRRPIASRLTAGTRLRWLALSFAPSTLMLGVTTYLSTDVAPVPLLWVLPLACYLLTFIVAFGWYSEQMHTGVRRLLPSVLLPLVLLIVSEAPAALWVAIPIHVLAFTVLAMLCHGELACDRPGVQHLTEFYLWLAAGGVLGGVFNTLVAPQVFTSVAEYPLAIAFACLVCVPKQQFRDALANPRSMLQPALAAGLATVLLVGARLGGVAQLPTLAFLGVPALDPRERSEAAIPRDSRSASSACSPRSRLAMQSRQRAADRRSTPIARSSACTGCATEPARNFVSLMHGTTIHGRQVIGDTNPEPQTYFHRKSPIGNVFETLGADATSVGVIGLGTGTLAAYAQPGSQWTFYEIDGAVERIARDTRFFHYLDRCGAQCSVVLGDARLTLAASQVVHDVLVLDAFSSDAIPIHLLTTEALLTYETRLSANGVLAFHISNRHIKLAPVIARLARERGLTALTRLDKGVDSKNGFEASEWVVMARRPERLQLLAADTRWTPLVADARTGVDGRFFQYLDRIALVTNSAAFRLLTNATALFLDGTRATPPVRSGLPSRFPPLPEGSSPLGVAPNLMSFLMLVHFGRQNEIDSFRCGNRGSRGGRRRRR